MSSRIATVILALSLEGGLCAGQSSPDPLKIGSVTVQGSIRTRVEGWQWFEGLGNSDYVFSGSLLRLSFSHVSPTLDWRFEIAAPILLGLPDDPVGPGAQGQLGLGASYYVANHQSRNAAMTLPVQGYLRFKNLFGSESNALRIGRFEFADGGEAAPEDATLTAVKRNRVNQRLIGQFTYTHVERSFYGAHFQHDTPRVNWTLMGAFPTRGVFQVDGWAYENCVRLRIRYQAIARQVQFRRVARVWDLL
jgi:hypothetical protein